MPLSADDQKLGRGRPSKYKPEYCEQLVEFCKEGFSITAFAGSIDVARSTIQEWELHYPDFALAVSRAKAGRLLHWERAALNVATRGGGPGSATIITFGLRNMGADEWSDINRTEVSGPNGSPIRAEVTSARDLLASRIARIASSDAETGSSGEPE